MIFSWAQCPTHTTGQSPLSLWLDWGQRLLKGFIMYLELPTGETLINSKLFMLAAMLELAEIEIIAYSNEAEGIIGFEIKEREVE